MTDWERFCAQSIFHKPYLPVTLLATETTIGKTHAKFSDVYPLLTKLMQCARLTVLETSLGMRFLYSWDAHRGATMHLLCFPPGFNGKDARQKFHPDHILLLQSFGGIDEYSMSEELQRQSCDLWLQNLNFALGENDCHAGMQWNSYYDLLQEDEPFLNPIDDREYLTFAVEANANRTAYKVSDGTVILFATDHNFDYVTPFAGCPEQTLYTINRCPNFRDWVEIVAGQWDAIRLRSEGGK